MRSQDATTTATLTTTTSSSSSSSSSPSSVTAISLSSTNEPTCESRTVNYITHTLPQQCLTTSPSPPPTFEPVGVTATATATATTTTGADSSGAATDDAELDEDGDDLSTGAFMSFEEWKAMMVAKSDQEALDAKPRKRQDRRAAEGQPGGEYDALGEEGEIDFDAYSDKISEIAAGTRPSSQQERDKEEKGDLATTYDEDLAVYRSKDAGKTCKERFSYSSFDAGATTLKTSRGTKNPTAILGESKDSYMLMECATPNKFFIVELSDVILVDTVVLANYEFFSSMIRQFRVSVSDRYPVKLDKWTVLGTFEARNARDIQAFLVENPRIWARYLRVEILNHYGNEYYCPLSLLRVHGMRMLDSLRAADPTDLEAELEDESEGESEEASGSTVLEAEETKTDEKTIENVENVNEEATPVVVEPTASIELPTMQPEQSKWMAYWDPSYFRYTFLPDSTSPAAGSPYVSISPEETSEQSAAAAKPRPLGTPEQTSGVTISNASVVETTSRSLTESPTSDLSGSDTAASSPETPTNSPTSDTTEGALSSPTGASSLSITSSGHVNVSATTPNNNDDTPPTSTQSAPSGRTVSNNNTVAPTSVVKPPSPSSSKQQSASKGGASPSGSSSGSGAGSGSGSGSGSAPAPRNNNSSSSSNSNPSGSGSGPTTTTTTSSPPPTPTVQDSFFKTLTKRLQTLESNTTLSLQYIEQQSQFLRSALARLERRQVSRVDAFLDGLNRTVLVELRDARSQCDAIWQGTVLALESQREQAERELVALGERLGVLADEVVFQKRMAIAQSALLLVCLVLVIFSSRNGGPAIAGAGGMGMGMGMGMGAFESYYPSQFLAASPTFFPSTPKAGSGGGKGGQQQQGDDNNHGSNSNGNPDNRGPIISIDSPPPSGGGSGSSSFAYGRFPDSWPRPRYRQSPSQTLLEIARRQAMPPGGSSHGHGHGHGRGMGWGRGYGRSSSGGVVVMGGSSPDNNNNNDTSNNNKNDYNDRNDDNDDDDGGGADATVYSTQQQQQQKRPSSSQRAVTEPPPDQYERERGQGPEQSTMSQSRSNSDRNLNLGMDMNMDMDVGYDSEPAMTPNRRGGGGGGDYFQTASAATSTTASSNGIETEDGGNGTVVGGSSSRVPLHSMVPENTPTPPPPPSSSYTDVLARKVAERQLTPSSSSSTSDGETDYLPRSSRPPLSHTGSTRTALPALPEDAD
ncbi:hypothetical protein SLS62_009156 [Diatrype stigma]|uniref:SUN domain-containing protein n=1 Tax=Diatrype stigma TaxID=117547 RepID=A0AAN9UFV0_9PEZI